MRVDCPHGRLLYPEIEFQSGSKAKADASKTFQNLNGDGRFRRERHGEGLHGCREVW